MRTVVRIARRLKCERPFGPLADRATRRRRAEAEGETAVAADLRLPSSSMLRTVPDVAGRPRTSGSGD